MMSLLLASVSASALTAGAPPSAYPTEVNLTFQREFIDLTNTSTSLTFDLIFDQIGTYLLVVHGGQGGSGSSDSGLDAPLSINNGATLTLLDFAENQDYEVIYFYRVDIATAGTHNLNWDQAGQRFRIRFRTYLTEAVNWNALRTKISTASGVSMDFDMLAGEKYISVALGQGTSSNITTPTRAATTMGVFESSNFMADIYQDTFTVTGQGTFTVAGSSSSRAQVGVIMLPYLSEFESRSILVDQLFGYAVTGGTFTDGIAVQTTLPYVVFAGGGGHALQVTNARPYVIVEP